MNEQDIRWEQRLRNYLKALTKLEESANYIRINFTEIHGGGNKATFNVVLSELIRQGLIQSFEFTHELAWNVIKDYAAYQGNPAVSGSRDATRAGFEMGLIEDGEVWMEMIRSRNKTSHTYEEETANEIFTRIINNYLPAFKAFRQKMENVRNDNTGNLFA